MTVIAGADIGRHVAALTERGPRHVECHHAVAAALRYITDQLDAAGYDVVVERYGSDLSDVNLLAMLSGAPTGTVLEVAAHWDTEADTPGADDNASGVAGLLEVARVLSTLEGLNRTVRFCFFGGEEDPGPYAGSRAHVARLTDVVDGAIVLEMIGYRDARPGSQRVPAVPLRDAPPDRGDFIALVGDERAGGYLAALQHSAWAYAPDLPVVAIAGPVERLQAASRSDHVPYWHSGRRGLMVTDTADYRNPHYHRPSDTLDTLDLEFAAQVSRMVAGAVATLAGIVNPFAA